MGTETAINRKRLLPWPFFLHIILIAAMYNHPLPARPLRTGNTLTIEVWVEQQPMVLDTPYQPLEPEDFNRLLIDEAVWIVSGMIYGFNLRYIPSDRAVGVKEEFSLEPVEKIIWGDPNLKALDTRNEGGRYYARFRYDLHDFQVVRVSGWESNLFPTAQGRGSGPVISGRAGKLESWKEAVKNGVREYVRVRQFNRPREISCRVLLTEPPRTIIDAGGYHSTVRIRIRDLQVRPYEVY